MTDASRVTSDSGRALLVKLGLTRAALLTSITSVLEDDPRVLALWLEGSFGRGVADEWSDLDIHVAVADKSFDEFLSQRPSLYQAVGEPLLVQAEMTADAGAGAVFQLVYFPGPVEVDWTFRPAAAARRPAASAVLFDRVGLRELDMPPLTPEQRRARARQSLIFFWAMAPIAVKYAGRRQTQRMAHQIALLSRSFVVLWRILHLPDSGEPWMPNIDNRPLEPELEAALPVLDVVIDPEGGLAAIASLCSRVEQLHLALTELGIESPVALAGQVHAMIGIANGVLRSGTRPPRRGP